jgi:hypothetical protein
MPHQAAEQPPPCLRSRRHRPNEVQESLPRRPRHGHDLLDELDEDRVWGERLGGGGLAGVGQLAEVRGGEAGSRDRASRDRPPDSPGSGRGPGPLARKAPLNLGLSSSPGLSIAALRPIPNGKGRPRLKRWPWHERSSTDGWSSTRGEKVHPRSSGCGPRTARVKKNDMSVSIENLLTSPRAYPISSFHLDLGLPARGCPGFFFGRVLS